MSMEAPTATTTTRKSQQKPSTIRSNTPHKNTQSSPLPLEKTIPIPKDLLLTLPENLGKYINAKE